MKAKAYVDGSYNASTKVYGAGAVLFLGEGADPIPLSQPGNHPAFIGSRNVAGEVMAATLVIEACKKVPDLEELTLSAGPRGAGEPIRRCPGDTGML